MAGINLKVQIEMNGQFVQAGHITGSSFRDAEFVASEVIIKGITNKVSSSINVTIGKNGRYYELGRRGALKSKKAIQKLLKKDIAEGYFGQNIAPELASQIVDKAGEAALVVSGVKEKKEKLSIGERIFPELRKGGKDAEKK